MRFLIKCTCGHRFWRASVCTTYRNGAIKVYDCPRRKRSGVHQTRCATLHEQMMYVHNLRVQRGDFAPKVIEQEHEGVNW